MMAKTKKRSRNNDRNIIRVDNSTTHGYQLRMRRKGELVCSEFFSDGKFGSKSKALAAARKSRSQHERKHPHYTRKEVVTICSPKRGSTIPGVRLAKETYQYGEWEYSYWFWVAQWCPRPGERKTKRFSVQKYGDRKARQLAIEARREGVASMVN